eukprot:1154560-Pelagomonas_calceolata.AAC.3
MFVNNSVSFHQKDVEKRPGGWSGVKFYPCPLEISGGSVKQRIRIGKASPFWHRGGFDMQCWGQQQDLPAADPALFIQPAVDHAPEAPLSKHQCRGAGPAPHHISKLLCSHLYTRGAQQTTVSTSHHNWNYAIALAQQQAEMVCRWTAKSLTGPTPSPGPINAIYTSMLMKFALSGAVPNA